MSELENERVLLAEMVELAPFYIMVLRGQHLLVEAFNPRFARLLKGREIQGRPLEIVFEHSWENGIPIIRAAHEVYEQNVRRIIPRILTRLPNIDGGYTESYFAYTLVPSHDARGNVSGVIIYAVDETEQDEFLSLASHELRTPLTSIIGYAVLLQRSLKRLGGAKTPKSDFARELHILDMIVLQSRRLSLLIEEMLDITRIRSEQFELKHKENVNIVELVRRVLEQQNNSSHAITLVAQDVEITGNYDEGRLEQVLINLISNAIKYSPAGKPIEVRIERNKHEVTIAVKDEGVGISEEQQKYIFERFYRANTDANAEIEGLGLGLYIAHEIVARHGGRMWLESKLGKGSTFYFSLPLTKND
jgi:signal transduction histidine kinase